MSSTDDGTSEQSTANLMWTTVLLGNAALRRPAANTNGLGIRLVEGKDFRELISGCVDGQCNTYIQYVSIFSDQEQMGVSAMPTADIHGGGVTMQSSRNYSRSQSKCGRFD